MASSDDLQRHLDQGAKALNQSENHTPSKAERRLNRVGDLYERVSEASGSPYATATSEVINAGVQYLQPEFDNFKAGCDILMKTLDAVAKIHPFVTVAVLAFKAAIAFEMTRRQNDKRMLALHVEMKDMMTVIGLLRNLTKADRGTDGTTIEDRLRDRMISIAKDIESCAATCDSFQKKKLIVKVFKSISWESKLEGFSATFDGHKSALYEDLSMHASLGIDKANKTLTKVDVTVKATQSKIDMIFLFQQLRSPEERDLIKFIDSRGGPDAFLKDDQLMNELIARTAKDDESPMTSGGQALMDLKKELKKDFTELVKENEQIFTNKFAALQDNIRIQMEATITRIGDRIIGSILAGPRDRLIDPIIYDVWTEMGWKGSTEARYFVMAFREFYAERYHDAVAAGFHTTPSSPVDSSGRLVTTDVTYKSSAQILPEDHWALEYISITRIQPLLEAIDEDASSLITVSEVNSFTQARPSYWSLTHWMAYWTVGFPLMMRYYYGRVRETMLQLANLSDAVLPSNRAYVDRFLGSVALRFVDAVLAGVYMSKDTVAWDDELFAKFKRYTDEQEARLEKTLNTIKYVIDSPTTLTLLFGSGRRLEQQLLPLIFLVLRRCHDVLNLARSVPIHQGELLTLTKSFDMTRQAVDNRVRTIQAMSRLQNLDARNELQRYSSGIYYYVSFSEDFTASQYYKTDYFEAAQQPYADDESVRAQTASDIHDILRYGPQVDQVDLSAYQIVPQTPPLDPPPSTLSPAWQVFWRGFYEDIGDHFNLGHLDLMIPSSDGIFSGSGFDSLGDFSVTGKRVGDALIFDKSYEEQSGTSWRFSGTIDDNAEEIAGSYGYAQGAMKDTLTDSPSELADTLGDFVLRRRPIVYWSARPDEAVFRSNKARALWRYALDAVLNAVRSKADRLSWVCLQGRRNKRKRYCALYAKLNDLLTWRAWGLKYIREVMTEEEQQELGNIERSSTPSDLRFYRSLANSIVRREVIHSECFCDSCGKDAFLMTRLVCLDCSTMAAESDVETVDLCTDCVASEFTRESDNKAHTAFHRLLQIRRSVPDRRIYHLVSQAQDAFVTRLDDAENNHNDAMENDPKIKCLRCERKWNKPYWYCIDCEVNTYVCMECNAKDEQDHVSLIISSEGSRLPTNVKSISRRPSLFKTTHHWSHSLVLAQPPPPPPAPQLSVEDRLSSLEKRFTAFEGSVAARDADIMARLQRLEDLLSRLTKA